MGKILKNIKGFTIVENIFSVSVIAIGLVGGMTVMQNAAAKTVNNDMTSIATQVANEKIEIIMGDKEFQGYDYVDGANYPSEDLSEPYTLERSIEIYEVSTTDLSTPETESGLKKLIVTVSWGEKDYQKVEVSTLLADL